MKAGSKIKERRVTESEVDREWPHCQLLQAENVHEGKTMGFSTS